MARFLPAVLFAAAASGLTGEHLGTPTPAPLPAVTLKDGPVVNGIKMTDPGWGDDQPLVSIGLLDITKPPFSADPTGKVDATEAIQRAVEAGRSEYLTVFFPSGSYRVTSTIAVVQPEKYWLTTTCTEPRCEPNCNEMREILGGDVVQMEHCSRTAPVVLQGTRAAGATRPELFVPAGTDLSGPVVRLHNPINENINMNQEIHGLDIRIEKGNPNAVGIYSRGAQGVTVQDVVIRSVDASIGLEGGAGSGGGHIGVTIIGGRIGMKVGAAQPAPTLTSIRLMNQSVSALVYQYPGRQALSITGLVVEAAVDASGPAIDAGAAVSIVDAQISTSAATAAAPAIVAARKCSLFLQDVWVQGFPVAVALANGTELAGATDGSRWARFRMVAAASSEPQRIDLKSSAFVDGEGQADAIVYRGEETLSTQDPYIKHLWAEDTPTWESKGACFAKDYGAKGDLVTDDTDALQRMLNDPKCRVSVLEKGYFGVSRTLDLAANSALVGVGLIYSNLVPHRDACRPLASPDEKPWPLLRTSAGAEDTASIVALSFLIWRHTNATYAFHWRSGSGLWRRAHFDRLDLGPGAYQQVLYNQALSIMDGHGGGTFYNFYQENWDFQGPKYRHLVISGTDSPFICYQCNLEHSQGEANLEIRGVLAPVRIYGFKGESNYVQIWVADSADFELSGYGGNASPFPVDCYYPPGYVQYTPSILRVERVPKLLIGNIVVQDQGTETRCGIFDTGFMGTFYDSKTYSVLFETTPEGKNITIEPMQWPHFYSRGRNFGTFAEVSFV